MANLMVKSSGGKICPRSDLRVGESSGQPSLMKTLTPSKKKNNQKQKVKPLNIGTWNVRTMNGKEKIENLKRELVKYNIDILGLAEVRWEGEGEIILEDYKMVYKGGEKKERGVGFIIRKTLEKTVTRIIPKSDRIIAMKLSTDPIDTLIIQVYMPTSETSEETVDEVYKQIEEILEEYGRGQVRTMIMGDWNSVIGDKADGNVVGEYGLGTRNERGEKLVEFCKEFGFWISNTWFKQHKRRLYTWKSPGDRKRYQLDYILINQRFKNSIKTAKTFPGADIFSDHNLLIAEVRTRLKHIRRKGTSKKWNLEKLKSNESESFTKGAEEELMRITPREDPREEWNNIKSVIIQNLNEKVGEKKKQPKKEWVTQAMIEKMDERRKWKNVSSEYGKQQYRKLNNELRRESDRAREKWMQEQCEKIEELNKYCKLEEMYRVVKEVTRKKSSTINKRGMKKRDGMNTINEKENKELWEEYIKELYESSANVYLEEMENENEYNQEEMGYNIEEWEVKKALKELKYNKAMGIDNIPAEALKTLGPEGITRITRLMNIIYDTGIWPDELTKTILLPLPKKPNANQCKDYRTISFICHITKAITRILIKRIEGKIEEHLGDDQFGFRKGRGTKDAMGCLRLLGEKMMEMKKKLYICFIDWEKAFDRVNWNILMKILKEIGLKWKDRRLIRELYKNQKVIVRLEDEETEEVIIGRGVRQGCCMSPALFNLYAERLLEEALNNTPGVNIGNDRIKNIKYADDQAVLAESEMELKTMVESICEAGKRYGMKINVGKTKVMMMGNIEESLNITLEGEKLEQVHKFKYLGGMIYSSGSCTEEIRGRISMGKTAYVKVQNILTARRIPLQLRKRFAKCFIWSVVLYGSETWTLRKKEEKYLESFEMWLWRRMENIKWSDKIRNEEVLRRVEEERNIVKTIKKRKASWVGHILRRDCIQRKIMDIKFEGSRSRGRRKFGMLTDILRGRTYEQMKNDAQDRESWRRFC
ncbi:hypothetical protein M8J77_020891 [Diaphorina citri]|nr:hypothetical protein M8J77_020891 [Diaphorina citri]